MGINQWLGLQWDHKVELSLKLLGETKAAWGYLEGLEVEELLQNPQGANKGRQPSARSGL